jgi:hypothetical protein
MRFDIEPHDTFLRKLTAVLVSVALVVILLGQQGCAHTADWDPAGFELKELTIDGRKVRAWTPRGKCDPFRVLRGDGPTFECCIDGICHALPIFLNVDQVKQ